MEIVENQPASETSGARRSVGFTTRKIACQQTLGEHLAQRRAAQGFSVEEVARQLNISPSYLQALELGDHRNLPGTVYACAFLKAYARLLNLDGDEAVARYRSELKISRHARGEGSERWKPVHRAAWWHFLVPARLLRNAMIAVVLVAALTYLGFKVEAIVQPPLLSVSSPADELLTDHPLLTVVGQTDPGSTVTVNGQEVIIDAAGRFTTPFDLQPGVNLVRVTARKHRGSEAVILRRVVLQPAENN